VICWVHISNSKIFLNNDFLWNAIPIFWNFSWHAIVGNRYLKGHYWLLIFDWKHSLYNSIKMGDIQFFNRAYYEDGNKIELHLDEEKKNWQFPKTYEKDFWGKGKFSNKKTQAANSYNVLTLHLQLKFVMKLIQELMAETRKVLLPTPHRNSPLLKTPMIAALLPTQVSANSSAI